MINSTRDISPSLHRELNKVAGGDAQIVSAGINRALQEFSCDVTESEIRLEVMLERNRCKKEARLG